MTTGRDKEQKVQKVSARIGDQTLTITSSEHELLRKSPEKIGPILLAKDQWEKAIAVIVPEEFSDGRDEQIAKLYLKVLNDKYLKNKDLYKMSHDELSKATDEIKTMLIDLKALRGYSRNGDYNNEIKRLSELEEKMKFSVRAHRPSTYIIEEYIREKLPDMKKALIAAIEKQRENSRNYNAKEKELKDFEAKLSQLSVTEREMNEKKLKRLQERVSELHHMDFMREAYAYKELRKDFGRLLYYMPRLFTWAWISNNAEKLAPKTEGPRPGLFGGTNIKVLRDGKLKSLNVAGRVAKNFEAWDSMAEEKALGNWPKDKDKKKGSALQYALYDAILATQIPTELQFKSKLALGLSETELVETLSQPKEAKAKEVGKSYGAYDDMAKLEILCEMLPPTDGLQLSKSQEMKSEIDAKSVITAKQQDKKSSMDADTPSVITTKQRDIIGGMSAEEVKTAKQSAKQLASLTAIGVKTKSIEHRKDEDKHETKTPKKR